MDLKIEAAPGAKPGVKVLHLAGPFTLRSVFEFRSIVQEMDDPIAIVDLTDVPFMDSAALGAVMFLHTLSQQNQRRYALVGVSKRLHDLFKVVGVDQILVTFSTQSEAESKLVA